MNSSSIVWKPINENLYNKTKQLLETAVSFVQPLIANENVDEFLKKAQIDYPYIARFISKNLPDYFKKDHLLILTEENKKEIQEKQEYLSFKNAMIKDNIISSHFRGDVGNSSMTLTLNEWNFFYYMLDLILESYSNTDKFDYNLFDKLYHDMESFFYEERIPINIIAPLYGFKPHANVTDVKLNIDDNLSIREISEEERKLFLHNMIFNRPTPEEIHTCQYVIQYQAKIPKFLKENQENNPEGSKSIIDYVQKILNNVITTLRLLHEGAVEYLYIYC